MISSKGVAGFGGSERERLVSVGGRCRRALRAWLAPRGRVDAAAPLFVGRGRALALTTHSAARAATRQCGWDHRPEVAPRSTPRSNGFWPFCSELALPSPFERNQRPGPASSQPSRSAHSASSVRVVKLHRSKSRVR